MTTKQAKDFVRAGYDVVPGMNGGFTVMPHYETGSGYARSLEMAAAFTNSADFLAWITKGHAEYDKERAV